MESSLSSNFLKQNFLLVPLIKKQEWGEKQMWYFFKKNVEFLQVDISNIPACKSLVSSAPASAFGCLHNTPFKKI